MSRLSNKDVDELVKANYEEALPDGEPWAIESYEYNHPEAAREVEEGET